MQESLLLQIKTKKSNPKGHTKRKNTQKVQFSSKYSLSSGKKTGNYGTSESMYREWSI